MDALMWFLFIVFAHILLIRRWEFMDIGQMFLLGFDGCTADSDHWLTAAITRDKLGGIILFDRNVDGSVQNIRSPGQLQELTARLQEIAPELLLVAVDQEGGRVCRLRERDGFPATLSAAVLGREEPAQSTTLAAESMASTLSDAGINMNLAPVVDLDLNPDNPIISRYERSFGSRADRVAAHALAFIDAHHARSIACCLKHFPGHGSSRGDSHLGFVDITADWQQQELDPYRQVFAAGFEDAVMTAHVVHFGLDPAGLPATLSPLVINGILRRDLGFAGVTMTDDLQMQAIAGHYGFREAVQRAVLAGVDLMVVGNNLQRSGNALCDGIAAIRELLDRGKVDADYIEASLTRIKQLKQKIQGEVSWKSARPTVQL
jgi:beta-N-acetylhexosaminidase